MVGVLDVEGFFAWEQAVSGTQAKNGTMGGNRYTPTSRTLEQLVLVGGLRLQAEMGPEIAAPSPLLFCWKMF